MSLSGRLPENDERLIQLLDQAMLLAQDQLDKPLAIDGDDELALLAQCLNRLQTRLQEKAALEERMVEALAATATGSLLRVASHDLNNILGAFMNAVELLVPEVSADSEFGQTALDTLRKSSERARNMLTRLMQFAKANDSEKVAVDLNSVVGEVARLCGAILGNRHSVEVKTYPEPAVVEGSPAQLRQALTALCLRAREAMPQGGTIQLEIEAHDTDQALTPNAPVMPGRHFAVLVGDTGKPMGLPDAAEASGDQGADALLMSGACEVVARHQGRIDVRPGARGTGTTLAVLLPASARRPVVSAAAPAARSPIRPARPGETILVIDDEEAIRNVTQLMLTRLGYEVLHAGTGREAIALFGEHHAKVAAVMLDLILPDQDAASIHTALIGIDPDAKVVAMSGFTRDPRIADLLARGCHGFLQKPYNYRQLTQALGAVLGN